MARLTKQGALIVGEDLDKMATLIQKRYADLGIPQRIALDFAKKCDLLSDHIQRSAGIDPRSKKALTEYDPVKEPGFNPEEIGQEKAGPLVKEGDETYMDQHFTQQQNRELRERVQDGSIGPDKIVEEPQAPQPGKQAADRPFAVAAKKADDDADEAAKPEDKPVEQAEKPEGEEKPKDDEDDEDEKDGGKKAKKAAIDESIARLRKQADEAQVSNLGALADQLKTAAYKLDAVGDAGAVSGALKKLVTAIDKVREVVIKAGANGFDDDPGVLEEADRVATASSEVLPYVNALAEGLYASKDGASPTAQLRAQELLDSSSGKVTKLIGLAQKIVDESAKKIGAVVAEVTGDKGGEG